MLSKRATARNNIPAIQRSLGLTYSKLGRIDEANQASRRALELSQHYQASRQQTVVRN